MVIVSFNLSEQASRAFTRPALHTPLTLHNGQLNVSIRADIGESPEYMVDSSYPEAKDSAIEVPVIMLMSSGEIMTAVVLHKGKFPASACVWFAGVRAARRLHPWDEQALPFQTKAWLDFPADSGGQAQRVARALFAMGCEQSPMHNSSPAAKHVFVYSLSKEIQN